MGFNSGFKGLIIKKVPLYMQISFSYVDVQLGDELASERVEDFTEHFR